MVLRPSYWGKVKVLICGEVSIGNFSRFGGLLFGGFGVMHTIKAEISTNPCKIAILSFWVELY